MIRYKHQNEHERRITSKHQCTCFSHTPVSYKNIVCTKPWGFEYIIYESKKIGIWWVTIHKNQGTSLHTHFHKHTFLICINGCATVSFLREDPITLSCLQSVFIPKEKFHSITSITDNSVLMEIEIFDPEVYFSDKNDLLRIEDPYRRPKTGYESSIQATNDESSCFYLEDGFDQIIHDVRIQVRAYTRSSSIYSILLQGELYQSGHVLKEGSVLDFSSEVQSLSASPLMLTLDKLYSNEDEKIIYSLEHLSIKMNDIRNKKIVLTSGCFDILHVGHLEHLKKAKSYGDILIVCLSNDEQIKALKGDNRPVNNYQDRLNLFKTIPYVDYIILYEETDIKKEETLDNIMNIVHPDYWTKGDDYTENGIREKHPSLKHIILIPNIKDKSTTNIIKKIIK